MGISLQQALDCFRSDDLIGIGMEADAVRRRLHPEGVVSYSVEAVIDCDAATIYDEIADAEEMGASGIVLRGGVGLESLEVLVAGIKQRFTEMWLQGFSAAELAEFGPHAIIRLRDAGLDAIGGPEPETPDEAWLAAHRAAHQAGMSTSARIVFGAGETFADRLAALDSIRELQAETGGFASLAPVSFHAPGGRELDETTAVEYLKTLAVARMYVENIENVQADWTTQGLKVLQMGLRFGANDVGAVRAETRKGATEEELRRIIRDAGFQPAQRAHGFRLMLLA
jgi:cyclic dehypoxanthinyl futalosine synthase